MTLRSLTKEEITERLKNRDPKPEIPPYPESLLTGETQPAAVLMPFLWIEGAWHLLFIRRSVNDVDRHSGQVAFPGGRGDPEDLTPEDTALREAAEEIGVDPEDVRILGRLNDTLTISNYQVVPVAGVIPWPYAFHPDEREVDRIFTIPLDWLDDPANHEIRQYPLPEPHQGALPVVHFKEYDGEFLWGATARILLNLLETLRDN